jgi:long-chain acyl-CoA synthetase
MSSDDTRPLLFGAASVALNGDLPQGDPRIWAHTVTDVVAAFISAGHLHNVQDCAGVPLDRSSIEARWSQLCEAGLKSGDVVIVETCNTLRSVESVFAAWPASVKKLIASEANARASITADGELTVRSHVAASGLIKLRRPPRVTGPDIALMIFTSGSSGAPKGVLLSHENVMSALRAISTYLKLQPTDRILCVPPLFFDYGLYQLLLTLFNNCLLTLSDRHTSAVMLLKLIEASRATVLPVVPALAAALAKMLAVVGKQGPHVRLVTNTGGHLTQSAIAALGRAFPNATVMPMYGLTECKRVLYLDTQRFDASSGAVGRPMPGMEARVVVQQGDTLRDAQPSEIGELYVRSASVMQGYQRVDADDGARVVPGRYRSDMFSVDDRGLFHFRGRSKSLIKQGGYCVVAADVERMAETHPQIAVARVVGRMEESGDESVVLFVQALAAVAGPQQKKIAAELKQMIHKTLMPREIHFIDEWPATANGKIDQRALVQRAALLGVNR